MDARIIDAQDLFLAKINQMCSKFGLNNIMAELYAVLYLNGRSMSLDDMVERLKISKGSASVNIRALERYGVVRRVWVKGSRKDYYEAEKDIAKVIVERIRSMAQRSLGEVESMISVSTEALTSIDPGSAEEKMSIETFKARLEELRDFHAKAKAMFDLFNMSFMASSFMSEPKELKEPKERLVSVAKA